MGFAAHTKTATYQKMSVRLFYKPLLKIINWDFFREEKAHNSGNSPLGHLHLWSGDTKFGTEIWLHDVCICYLCWRDTSIEGTLGSGPEGFPWIEVVLCAFLTERIPRVSLECRGSIVCAFYRTYKSVSKTNDRGASLDRRHCSYYGMPFVSKILLTICKPLH